ncbi:GNAT family N-acetyltransferase [Pedobacter sp. GR22-6]|uniref:GNAT family N-acetyltransferase n=1 Tax=Pedobacter sp. GR22-6 TaxID=3127957 RepID=UPI00307E3D15
MGIRIANDKDIVKIGDLLAQLGYPTEPVFLREKILQLLGDSSHVLVVYEERGDVESVMSIHFVPQLALVGDFAIISYLAVDANSRSKGIGKALEEYCVELATERNCDRIQVHCNIRRTDAHRFYERQGYTESRKYFSKKLERHLSSIET